VSHDRPLCSLNARDQRVARTLAKDRRGHASNLERGRSFDVVGVVGVKSGSASRRTWATTSRSPPRGIPPPLRPAHPARSIRPLAHRRDPGRLDEGTTTPSRGSAPPHPSHRPSPSAVDEPTPTPPHALDERGASWFRTSVLPRQTVGSCPSNAPTLPKPYPRRVALLHRLIAENR
jgi:hypothetical protein